MRILVHICCGPCGITVLQRLRARGHELAGLFFNPNIQPLAEYMRRREGAALVAARLDIPLILADSLPEAEQRWRDPWLPETGEAEPPVAPSSSVQDTDTPLTTEIFPDARVKGAAAPLRGAGWSPASTGLTSSPRPSQPTGLPPAVDPIPWLRAVAGRERERCLFCWRVRLRKTAELAAAGSFDGFSSSLLYSRYQKHETIRNLGFDIAASNGPAFVYEDFRTFWQEGIARSKDWGIYRQQYCGCLFSEYDRYRRDFDRLRGAGG